MPEPIETSAPLLPSRAIIRQRWSDLVFLHWRVAPDAVAPFLPTGTRPDVDANGDTWVGLIPFVLSHSQFFPPLPAIPYVGTFVECNVRLYSVDASGRRGVVFRSLDAQRALAVLTARALFGLPYRWASMSVERGEHERLDYRSRRLEGSVRPSTHVVARPGSTPVDTELSRFLTARWGFHERVRGHTIWARNYHEPWSLFEAKLESLDDELLAAAGFPDLAGRAPDSVFYSPGVSTVFSRPTRVD
jgi:uncharacterized protein YqjF (DUF2071 family)